MESKMHLNSFSVISMIAQAVQGISSSTVKDGVLKDIFAFPGGTGDAAKGPAAGGWPDSTTFQHSAANPACEPDLPEGHTAAEEQPLPQSLLQREQNAAEQRPGQLAHLPAVPA